VIGLWNVHSKAKPIARLKTGYKEGRPKKYSAKQINHALQLLETHSYKGVRKITGISKSTLIRAKKEKYRSYYLI